MTDHRPPDDLNAILNFLQVDEKLASAGQPTRAQLAEIYRAGYQVVINLAMPDSTNAIPEEGSLVTALGMEYIHIPVVWENPTAKDLEAFFAALQHNRSKKVFVHCALNMRVSAFLFLYRVTVEKIAWQEAYRLVQRIWQPNPLWREWMNDILAAHGSAIRLPDVD